MSGNPIEENLALQAVFVVGIVLAMVAGGQVVGERFLPLDIPYAGEIGFLVGATVVFVVVAILYRGVDAYYTDKQFL